MRVMILFGFFFYLVDFGIAEKSLSAVWSPCTYGDNKCVANQWQDAVNYLASGSEEWNVPPLDPLKVDNIDVDIPRLVYMHFDGFMRGMKGCSFDDSRTSIKKGTFKLELDLNCKEITLKGRYNVTANTSVLFELGNQGILKADGIGKAKLNNLRLTFIMDFAVKKDAEGIVKFILNDGPIGYKYKIGGPVQFASTKIYLGTEDITQFIIPFINENWKIVMDIFGGYFFQKAMEIVSEFPRAVINVSPVSSYFFEDMGQYALDS